MSHAKATLKLADGKWFRVHDLEFLRGGFTCSEAWQLARPSDTVHRPSTRRWFPASSVEGVYEIEEDATHVPA